ncbi:hypothetical protein GCM10007870_30060 [Gluconobacter kondonii]|uniref:Uncharacterized protein n=1 Tax=Gluconobacter kondonii TaxID=941463 RepID=A0ABQ5WV44_9PROT|nr:hypothetical protein GCM10007870_30060 [Gluconobacter kondonii]
MHRASGLLAQPAACAGIDFWFGECVDPYLHIPFGCGERKSGMQALTTSRCSSLTET